MKQRRIYNPAHLSPDELKASFVAREETLTEMLLLLGEQNLDRPCQHMLLVGSRGMGKTTLGLRFLQAVRETPGLAEAWQPVAFHEESYQVTDLADFWLTALHHLTRATRDSRWADKAEALSADEKDPQRLAAYALSALIDFCRERGKRLILFVENLDIVFSQLGDEREVHALRAALIEHPEILMIGSANAVFEAIRHRGEPFYEFFRVFLLEGLECEEYLQIFRALAEREGKTEIAETLNRERGRIETIRRLTGGNPRLLVLTYGILIESPLGSAFKTLEQLIDEQTPYFKSRVEELPTQSRKVFHCLAEQWSPMLAREVSVAARLSSSHASAQLKQLVDKGYAREARSEREKRVRYEVADRFYNIYFLLRFSQRGYRRLKLLVAFLNDLFGPVPMRSMYLATLESSGVSEDREGPELLGYYDNSESGCKKALELDPECGDAWRAMAEAILRGGDAVRLEEAKRYACRAVELMPEDPAAFHTVSDVLARYGNWTAALEKIDRALSVADGKRYWNMHGLTESLINLTAAGFGQQVRRIMESHPALSETTEPLWHAVRAETGEELESLPAEITQAVIDIRKGLPEKKKMLQGTTPLSI